MSIAALVPLADKVPKDNDVVAGWGGFIVFVLLAAAVAFLGYSLNKHLKKAREPWPGDPVDETEVEDAEGSEGSGGQATHEARSS